MTLMSSKCRNPEKCLKRMKILKKTFAIRKAFDYISAPRQTESV
ncbi:hypothetical protein C4K23_1818 [Pseudomonas chlororaphis]|uniref:Uncharacterized protein n=2 Tax=Pseudomonas chlororaphis TaxID=587753 RepID=A0A3G7TN42_9PSED|nr:hypothetical protein C4K23_1818 [Pseudomonas chlororaphis]AZD53734.1 hypothetical protein C4K19_1936 [Pseudomonas chlororaphis subsp. aurantiaca]AZD84726.1 hypothetical protein C4K14_1891 [Pseudomonas chlororaphis subsp. aureofaciens]AZD91334.1 hypothetical protein C4K13_1906 [Pseudomonas chlororaphis subsp. aureofaciens]AZE04024.1 hypothetical protein C4K11_1851 [Pseudomonas chlororaphis subsp. aureofaciens]